LEKKQAHLVQFTVDRALPISISERERLFSSAKFTLNPLRTYMKSDLFEVIETLRAWYLQDQQDMDRAEKDIRLEEEQKVISETIRACGGGRGGAARHTRSGSAKRPPEMAVVASGICYRYVSCTRTT
jgi:hypothetical protein